MTKHIRYCGLLKLVTVLHGGRRDPHYSVYVFDQSGPKAKHLTTLRELRLAPYKRERLEPDASATHTLVAFAAMQFMVGMDESSDFAYVLGQFEPGESEDTPVIRHLTLVRR